MEDDALLGNSRTRSNGSTGSADAGKLSFSNLQERKMKVDCESCSRSINTSRKTVERIQTMSTRPFEFLAEMESCGTLMGGKGEKRKADDAFQSVSNGGKLSAQRKRIKVAELENTRDREMTSYQDKTSSGGRGGKRKADDAFQSGSGGGKPSAHRKRIKVAELENTSVNADTEMSSSGGRGVKRKADDDFQSVSGGVKPYALRKRIKVAETSSDENSSSGGRGGKRKADDAFQSVSDGVKPYALRKRIQAAELENTSVGTDTETSSSAPRGQKRKAGRLDQDSRNQDTVAAQSMKTAQIQHGGSSGRKTAAENSSVKDSSLAKNSSSGSLLDKYVLGKKLGQGYHGIVYLATRKSDGQKVAIKVVNKEYYGELYNMWGFDTHVIPEAHSLMILKRPPLCPHIIELYEYAMEGRNNYLVMEYAVSYTTLGKFIRKNNGRLSESVARPLIMQLIIAAQRCIEHGIYHESMHLENILVNPKTLQLKLIDFGHSSYVSRGHWRCPTLGITRYRKKRKEPYRLILHAVSEHVCAVGRVLSYMVNGHRCFSSYRRPLFHPSLSAECRDLFRWLYSYFPETGPVLEELLEHKWFSMT